VGQVILIILIILIGLVGTLLLAGMNEMQIRRQPVQNIHVEVIGLRTAKAYSSARGMRRESYTLGIVAFRLPDGTEKELKVGSSSFSNDLSVFNNLQEGDTGMLSFQEHKNINNSDKRFEDWAYRYFLSFEKES